MNEGTAQWAPLDHDPDDTMAAYALGVLDSEERRQLGVHLAVCPACRAALARHEEVVGAIGSGVTPVAPRPDLRDALLAEIRADAAPAPRRRRVLTIGLGVAAAIALVSIVALSLLLARTMEERDEARYGEREIAEYLREGGTLSALVPAPGAPPDAAPGHGSLAMVPDGSQAMLVVHNLPNSGDGRRYIAWAERDGERVELGELRVNGEGVGWLLLTGPEPMSSYETVGITRYSPDALDGEPFLVAPVR